MGTRQTLVFIHGSGGNRAVWVYQSRYFSRNYDVVAVDLPGHGSNTEKPRATVGEYEDYVKNLIEAKSLASPIVVGHSMGGAIALRLALDAPAAVGGLVLVGTGARLRVLPAFFDTIKRNFDAALAMVGDYAFSPQTPREMATRALGEMKKCGPELLVNDFAASDGFDVMDRLDHISAPTLVVVGRDDRMTPVSYSEYLTAHIPQAELRIIEGAGHMVMLEQPEAFNSVVDDFVRSLE